MKILLDTSFIITCVKEGIDFESIVEDMTTEKVEWIVPEGVLRELKELARKNKLSKKEKRALNLGLKILRELKPKIVKTREDNVDSGIVSYIKGKPIILATFDKRLKKRVKNNILTLKGKKGLRVV